MKKKTPPVEKPIWVHGEKQQTRRERKYEATMTRPWRMHYDLAYDFAGVEFDQYYRTRFGARFSAFFHLHIRSYGGSAKLYYQGDS